MQKYIFLGMRGKNAPEVRNTVFEKFVFNAEVFLCTSNCCIPAFAHSVGMYLSVEK